MQKIADFMQSCVFFIRFFSPFLQNFCKFPQKTGVTTSLLFAGVTVVATSLLLWRPSTVAGVHNVAGVCVAVVLDNDIPIISAAVVDTRCIHVLFFAADVPGVFAVFCVPVVAGYPDLDPL